MLTKVPTYLFLLASLILGMLLGGFFSGSLQGVATSVNVVISVIINLVPILIFVALSPAIASLADSGRANSLAGSVILWYLFTSFLAGLLGLSVSTLLFGLTLSTSLNNPSETMMTLLAPGESLSASRPLIAILLAVCFGLLGTKWNFLRLFLEKVQSKVFYFGSKIKLVIVPFVLFLGISVGVRFGAQLGLTNYVLMTMYTFFLCLTWTTFYVFILLKLAKPHDVKEVARDYLLPTAVFAAGTCSSLLTLPVNLANVKKQGVSARIADFVLPVGSVINLDASALAYVAYAPFVLSYLFGIQIDLATLLMAWPAIVLFTIAAPGLPAGMGTALWSATLFASVLNLPENVASEFVATWIAMSSGLPDMMRTATNCTSDGFASMIMEKFHGDSD
ncbi:MAG: cation:dicarboxylase symporter family transporter [Gemmatimonadota bacterium]|nr:cation:dicarboxylase symporter family transporter [Gemmatimonadota bacterium]